MKQKKRPKRIQHKKPKPPKRLGRIYIRVSEAEHKAIEENATAAGMDLSTFLRTVGQNITPIAARQNHEALQGLIKLSAALASLGNLFKMALNREEGWREQSDLNTINELYAEIGKTRGELMEKIQSL